MRYVIAAVSLVVGVGACWIFARPLLRSVTGWLAALTVVTITWNAVKLGFPVSDDFLMLATVAAAVRLLSQRRSIALPTWCLAGAGLVLVSIIYNAVQPVSDDYNLNRYVQGVEAATLGAVGVLKGVVDGGKLELAMVALPIIIIAIARHRDDVMRLADLWVVSATLCCLVAITDRFAHTNIYLHLLVKGSLSGIRIAPGQRLTGGGLSDHPDHLAVAALMVLPLAMLWFARDGLRRRLAAPAVAILATGIFISQSRSGQAIGAALLLASLFLVPQTRRAAAYAAVPVLLAAGAVLLIDTHLVSEIMHHTRFGTSGSSISDSVRAQVGAQGVRDFHHNPVTGIGYQFSDQAHSIYIEALASGGIVSLVGLVLYFAGALTTLKLWLGSRIDYFAGALAIGSIAWLLNGAYGNDLINRYAYLPLALLIAIWHLRRTTVEPVPPEQVAGQPTPNHQTRLAVPA